MLRDKEKAQKVSNAYPKVRVVSGDLDSAALLEEEARKADIVIRKLTLVLSYHYIVAKFSADLANAKHIESVEAIARGLTTPNRAKPGKFSLVNTLGSSNKSYNRPLDPDFRRKSPFLSRHRAKHIRRTHRQSIQRLRRSRRSTPAHPSPLLQASCRQLHPQPGQISD